MKILLNFLFVFSIASSTFAQPNWTPVIYTNNTVAYGIVTINGNPATVNDLVGAFVNNECRAVGNIVIDQRTAYTTLQIQGDTVELVNFKVFDASADIIIDLEYTTQTNPGFTIGADPNYLPLAANTTPMSELSVTPSNRSVNSNSGSITFSINSNINWTVSESVSWISSVSPTSGSNNRTLTVNYTENTTTNQRQGTITVSGGGITRQVTITQDPANNDLPSKPILRLPVNGNSIYLIDNNYVLLDWEDSDNTTGYEYELSRNSTFTDLIASDGCGTSEYVILSYLIPENTTYFWRIRASNNSGKSEWSEIWSFYILSESSTQTIADVKIDANNDYVPDRAGEIVTVSGVVNSINFTTSSNRFSYFIQDETGGIKITKGSEINGGTVYNIGDNLHVTGIVGEYRGEAQIEILDILIDVSRFESGINIVPIELSINELLVSAEKYEGKLVKINKVNKVSSSELWPSSGNDANIQITDSTNSKIILRIDKDSELDEYPEPEWPINVKGVVAQYSLNTPPNDGYQILISYYRDLEKSLVGVESTFFSTIPTETFLYNNYPNPFNPSTKISFGLPEQSTVSLIIYDITGKVVEEFLRNEQLPAGSYNYYFKAKNLSSGIYMYRLQADEFVETKKLIFMK